MNHVNWESGGKCLGVLYNGKRLADNLLLIAYIESQKEDNYARKIKFDRKQHYKE